ncbi:hypothetical protein CEV31_1195 [Brucella thiophenivorans]|uniref:Uncharacterized protein n=1 Tax=Brucella thiophenivorans TaxID=571255 RepID=A0A256FY55_9HYPH|nr:hypothetical protein CEV31_1195 [Brucella thiophenivorans]
MALRAVPLKIETLEPRLTICLKHYLTQNRFALLLEML